MVCNPGNYGRNTNICSNDDDKGTELICNNSDKSCVKKVAKSKYRSGFSETLPFNSMKFKYNHNHLIILETFRNSDGGATKGEVQRYCSGEDKDGQEIGENWDVSHIISKVIKTHTFIV